MKLKKKLWGWCAALLVGVMVCSPMMNMSAAAAYYEKNMFKSESLKGLQGGSSSTVYGGIKHTLWNVFIDESIYAPDSRISRAERYEFEGEEFYFRLPSIWSQISNANRQGMSLSIVFLLRKNKTGTRGDSSFLIDAASVQDGYLYYAPNTDLNTYGGRAMRAFWHYLMDRLESNGMHIDNFILGNEVNMPNQWHFSGNPNAGDVNNTAAKYADAYYQMWSAVREHTNMSRCSISLDHSWQNDNEGKGIAAKDFLHVFNDRLEQIQSGVDWCVSTHLHPAQLFDTEIWKDPHNLAPEDSSARILDGSNLFVMTNYIRDTWGEQHRVMLTEQGFTDECGEGAQAACLAYTYYAAMYDPMVDCFHITTENAGIAETSEGVKSLDFRIDGTLAEEVYTKIGNGNAEDQQWIADTCLPIIGVSSWEEIIPNFGQNIERYAGPKEVTAEQREMITGFVNRMYQASLGRDGEEDGLEYWTNKLALGRQTGAQVAWSFIFSPEFKAKNYCNEDYVKQLYLAFMGREYDESGLNHWVDMLQTGTTREEVFNGFSQSPEFTGICDNYGIELGDALQVPQYGTVPTGPCIVDGKEDGVTSFVKRLYSICLNREPEADGLEYWTNLLWNHECSGASAAHGFIFSEEFVNQNHSDAEYIEYLYEAFMGRASDASGKQYWLERMTKEGLTREDVFNGFVYSNEFTGICNSYGIVRD